MASLFEGFKDFLTIAVNDPDFRRKNTTLQDPDQFAALENRIRALTPDISEKLSYTEVISALGLATKDADERVVRFDPKGFETTFSAFREGGIGAPRHMWLRSSATDRARYLLSDGGDGVVPGNGVMALSSDVEVLYRFPHFGTDLVGNDEYEDSADALTFTVGAVEYIAIACMSREVVQIYEFADPYVHVATIGVIDTPGVDGAGLTEPWTLAVDETNEVLYVGCKSGQPAAASTANGFVATWDISVPATPVYVATPFFYNNTGRLIDGEVHTPNDIFFEADTLWISNGGDDTVGAFDLSGTVPLCRKYLEASGAGYTLRGPQQISVQPDLGGFKKVFVVNENTGTVEQFDYITTKHEATYGIRVSEDELGSYNRLSTSTYGALGGPMGVVADQVTIDDQLTNVFIVTDTLNKRLHRFNRDAYGVDNFVNFGELTFDVPVSINGWTTNGTFPIDLTTVHYRMSLSDKWQQLPQETSLPPTTSIQIKLSMKLDTRRFVRSDWYLRHLRINGEQA